MIPWNSLQQNAYKHTLKTNKSISKRFRVRGDGSLKRYVSSVGYLYFYYL